MTYKRFLLLCANSIIQYFNYAIFSFCSLELALKFMPGDLSHHKLLNFFGIITLTVLARPLGSLFLGSIGDKIGRKKAIIIAGFLSSSGSLLVPFIPSYELIGNLSSILLIIARMIFLAGLTGEIDGIRLYISENLPSKKQNLGNGIVTFLTQSGALAASLSLYLISDYQDGWKFCFLIGGILGLIFTYIRSTLPESFEYLQEKEKPSNYFNVTFIQIINGQFGLLCKAAIISGTIGCLYQFFIIFLPIYFKLELNVNFSYYLPFYIILYGIGGVSFGYIADIISGYQTVKKIALSLVITLLLLSYFLPHNTEALNYIILIGAFSISGFSVPCQMLIKNNINIGIRYRIFSLGHSIGSLLISSPTAFVCSKIGITFGINYIVIYPLFFLGLSFIAITSLSNKR